ncbi:outer membrane beta-barrel protein [Vibrio cholerae]
MKKTLLALALIGASATASADSWIYGGASVGNSDFFGDSSTSYNVHVGTGILPFIGLEAGYNKFGEFETASSKVKVDNVYFAAKPSLNLGPLQVYGKAGVHSWEQSSNNISFDDDGYDIMLGVGADYQIFGPLTVGAKYENYKMDKEDMGVFSLTASLNFL